MTTFSPMNYGAVGDGTTDDTTAVQACIDAAVDGVVLIDRMYAISAAVVPPDNVYIHGFGANAGFRALGSVNIDALITATGSTDAGTGRTISGNIAKFDSVLPMNTGHGLAAGDYIRIDSGVTDPVSQYNGGNPYAAAHVAKLLAATATSITLDFPLPFIMKTTDTYTIKKLTMRTGISIRGLKFEKGPATAAIVAGIRATHLDETCDIGGIVGRDLTACVLVASSYMATVRDIRTVSCGGAYEALGFYASTGLIVDGVQQQKSGNMHLLLDWVNYSSLTNIIGVKPTTRGVKVWGCHASFFGGVIQAQGESTAISLQQLSTDNAFIGLMAFGGKGAYDTGINDSQQHNWYNDYVACVARGHTFFDITNIYLGAASNQIAVMQYGTRYN